MKFRLQQKSYLIYSIPIIAAIIARFFTYFEWLRSPFRYYHILVGLDMRKFLVWGEQLYEGTRPFYMYDFFIAVLYGIFGTERLPEAIVLSQMLLGVLTAGLTVYVFRHLFKNRKGACLAGLFCALYAPLMVYETQILKEPLFLFLTFLSLSLLLSARKNLFPVVSTYFAGAVALLPFFVRFSGLSWFLFFYLWLISYCYRKKRLLQPLISSLLGSLTVMLLVAGYNFSHNQSVKNYFTPNMSYLLKVGATADIQTLSLQEKNVPTEECTQCPLSYIPAYISKLGYIFSAYEQPNNINYYFIRSKLPFLKFLLGPFILIPMAAAGLVLLLLNFKKQKKSSILILYMGTFVIPMLLFLPLARYKIALTPVFSIFASWWIMYVIKTIHAKQRNQLVKPLLLFLCALILSGYLCRELPERFSDQKAYGVAASYIPDQLMSQGKYYQAEQILEKYYHSNKTNTYILLNYASSLLGTNQPGKAERILLNHTTIKEPAWIGRYFYELGEATFMLNNQHQALRYYNSAMQFPISDQRLKLAKARIIMILKSKVPNKKKFNPKIDTTHNNTGT